MPETITPFEVDRVIKAQNLEVALAEYFSQPTKEQSGALQILVRDLQADIANFVEKRRRLLEMGH